MIEARGLVKRYGSTMAVNDLSFSVRPGMVTGFLGPNGAGKPKLGLRHFFAWTPVSDRSEAPLRTRGPSAAGRCWPWRSLIRAGSQAGSRP